MYGEFKFPSNIVQLIYFKFIYHWFYSRRIYYKQLIATGTPLSLIMEFYLRIFIPSGFGHTIRIWNLHLFQIFIFLRNLILILFNHKISWFTDAEKILFLHCYFSFGFGTINFLMITLFYHKISWYRCFNQLRIRETDRI